MPIRFILSLSFLVAVAAFPVAAAPSCTTLGWIEAVRAAQTLAQGGARQARLQRLYARADPSLVISDIGGAMTEPARARLAEFLILSDPGAGAGSPDPRLTAWVGSTLRHVECRAGGGTFGTGRTTTAADGTGRAEGGPLSRLGVGWLSVPVTAILIALIATAVICTHLMRCAARDRRRARRFVCLLPAALETETGRQLVRLVDISQTGCKIGGYGMPEIGSQVTVRIGRLDVDAIVAWRVSDAAGLQFAAPVTRLALAHIVSSGIMRGSRTPQPA